MSFSFKPVAFLPAKETDEFSPKITAKEKQKSEASTSGQEIREFYENLVSVSDSKIKPGSKPTEKLQPTTSQVTQDFKRNRARHATSNQVSFSDGRQISNELYENVNSRKTNLFLKCAQNGEIKMLDRMLNLKHQDVNACDTFGWTALMCASQAGDKKTVRYLLTKGADMSAKDSQGRTALEIAAKANHKDVVNTLICKSKNKFGASSSRSKREVSHSFFCDVCKAEFHASEKQHVSSTVHLFNMKLKPASTIYHIPENNPGFQLMLQAGWDKETGLGPDGSGLKYPIKTILKRDRSGLGAGKELKAKVTHFGPGDEAAIQNVKRRTLRTMRSSTLSKKARKAQQINDRSWETNFRIYYDS